MQYRLNLFELRVCQIIKRTLFNIQLMPCFLLTHSWWDDPPKSHCNYIYIGQSGSLVGHIHIGAETEWFMCG
jgi:hypothetical protein